jgi:3-oxoacyl-[acyl-carrier-protein] synthase-3
MHGRLELGKHCRAFDVNLGCSGYVYGLWLSSSLIASGGAKRVLLLVGDTISKTVNPADRSSAFLFGDAGTATILEYDEEVEPISFVLGTDGKGFNNLIIPAGGARLPHSEKTSVPTEREEGNIRSDENLYMNGAEVFLFTLREIPKMVRCVVHDFNEIDAVIMHQANKFILNYIAKKLKIPAEKIMLSLDKYGNTSSASIPLTISKTLSNELNKETKRLLLTGFGVGFSWGSAVVSCGPMIIPEIVYATEKDLISKVVPNHA